MANNRDRQHRFAWFVVLLLFAGSVLNYMDRSLVGVIMPQMRHQLSLSNADVGMALNAFLLMYGVFYILGGRIADRLGYRATVVLTLAFWSLAGMAHALVQGLRSLVLCRAMLGMGEGGFYPAAMRGAAEWFPPEHRAKAVGLILSALSVGALLTPPLVAWITLHHGWRASFLAIGAVGLLLLAPWILLHRRIDRMRQAPNPASAERQEHETGATTEADPSLREVLKTRKYWCVLAARASTDATWYFYLFWTHSYFQEVRRFDLASVGRFLWIPFFGAGVGALAGAWASSALIRRGLSLDRSRKTASFASLACCVAGATVYFAPSAYLAIALVSLALFGQQAWGANIHTIITEITPPKHIAALYGLTGAAGTLLGAAAQLVIGRVIDLSGYKPAFVWAGLMPVLAAVLLLAAGTIERIRRVT
jgi:ACS family hexuronate transporter-like MFS transporter